MEGESEGRGGRNKLQQTDWGWLGQLSSELAMGNKNPAGGRQSCDRSPWPRWDATLLCCCLLLMMLMMRLDLIL